MPEQRLVAGRYRLIHPLAEGGFGLVWKAHDELLRADAVIKEVRLPPTADPHEKAERLTYAEREARNAARLRHHPGIVPVYDVAVEDGRPWIVMQLVDGGSLEDRLHAGPLPAAETVELADALLQALDAAHRVGVVHRDVKPANVMLADDGRILLTDFGIATHLAETRLTVDGSIIGSLEYMAPERLNGDPGTPAGDLFSLGVTLYQAVEGTSPFRRGSYPATMAAIARESPPPPRRAGRLTPLIRALLVKDPTGRPTIPEALALLHSRPPARRIERDRRKGRNRRRKRRPARPSPGRSLAGQPVSGHPRSGVIAGSPVEARGRPGSSRDAAEQALAALNRARPSAGPPAARRERSAGRGQAVKAAK
ncbi:serine/threonine-protein kinase [Actinoallomurus sp. NPDC052274]|uniref:serine/threonine-protein kinase n=1 Tax=Actinoallomurus sp. NPDC052274 TaxID=3155420 RepID=UPI003432DC4B